MCDVVVVLWSVVCEDFLCGCVCYLKGFCVEVNGCVYVRLVVNKINIMLKKCKFGMKYICVVVVMICLEKLDGY